MTFNKALAGVRDVNLDPSLRSKYVELIIGMSDLGLYVVYYLTCLA